MFPLRFHVSDSNGMKTGSLAPPRKDKNKDVNSRHSQQLTNEGAEHIFNPSSKITTLLSFSWFLEHKPTRMCLSPRFSDGARGVTDGVGCGMTPPADGGQFTHTSVRLHCNSCATVYVSRTLNLHDLHGNRSDSLVWSVATSTESQSAAAVRLKNIICSRQKE